jgi:two-component system, NarL family, nitrate/nitrite response regulator NarL
MAVGADVAPDRAAVHDSGEGMLRVAVVWEVRFLGEILAELLERDPMVSVVGVWTDLAEAVSLSPASQADVLLLDARMPEGIGAVRRALDIAPGMRIIVSAVTETEEDIVAWAEAGVIGYIPTSIARADFVRLLVEIHSGEQICSGRVANGLLRRIALTARRDVGRSPALPVPALTKRERQVAELIRSGLSDKEIARQLNISLATTKSHVHNLFAKLNLQRRSQVADCLRDYDHNRVWNYPTNAPIAADPRQIWIVIGSAVLRDPAKFPPSAQRHLHPGFPVNARTHRTIAPAG